MQQVPARYLARLAIVYLRQSTQQQVRVNEGSTQYQAEQRELAIRYGWRPELVRLISRDLGLSGMRSDRPGYLETLELIRAGEVGGLFISDASRAGREERAWFDLLDLLIKHDVLLFKGGVLTDPQDESQAFVTKLEALIVRRENQMRVANMHRGRIAKAKMNKAVSAPPVGYLPVYETHDGKPGKTGAWMKDPEPKVGEAIEAVFRAFREGRSLRRAVDLLNQRGVTVPGRRGRRPRDERGPGKPR
jgi:DNA invertase Pin-like site-specific DNA recombinase